MLRSNVPTPDLPQGWAAQRLNEIALVHGGGRLGLTKSDYRPSGVPAFSAAGLDGFVEQAEGIKPSIILSAIGARCGKCFLTDGPWTTLANTQVITPHSGKADARYLHAILNNEDYWNRSGSAQPFIKPSDVKGAWVPLPPLDEQRRIAEILRSVDESIAATVAVIEQAEAIWHGLTNALIWNLESDQPACVRPLGTALRATDYGVNVPLTLDAVGQPVLRMGNIQDGRIELSDLKWGVVHPHEAEALALSVGDILFNRTNSRDLVGKVALVREPTDCLYASYIVRLSVDCTLADPYYLFAVLHSDRAQSAIKAIATPGVSQSNINPTSLKKQPVPLPDLKTQRSIAQQLRSVEDGRLRSQQELEVLQVIKNDVSAALLSGRVRVPG